MGEEKLLTIREVSLFLEISEKEVIDLAQKGTLPAYRVGGVYLRFKREQVEEFKKTLSASADKPQVPEIYSLKDRIVDFLYFNDFYILSVILIVLILVFIFRNIE